MNGSVNMFSSLLPLRSNESVTGGFELKPLVQSHCDVLRSMRLGAVLNCSAAYQENAPVTLWRWQFTPKPQIALASHVLVEIRICSCVIFRDSQAAAFWVNATGRSEKVLSILSKRCTRNVFTMTIHAEAPASASSKIWMDRSTCSVPCCHWEAMNQWLVALSRSHWCKANAKCWGQCKWASRVKCCDSCDTSWIKWRKRFFRDSAHS